MPIRGRSIMRPYDRESQNLQSYSLNWNEAEKEGNATHRVDLVTARLTSPSTRLQSWLPVVKVALAMAPSCIHAIETFEHNIDIIRHYQSQLSSINDEGHTSQAAVRLPAQFDRSGTMFRISTAGSIRCRPL